MIEYLFIYLLPPEKPTCRDRSRPLKPHPEKCSCRDCVTDDTSSDLSISLHPAKPETHISGKTQSLSGKREAWYIWGVCLLTASTSLEMVVISWDLALSSSLCLSTTSFSFNITSRSCRCMRSANTHTQTQNSGQNKPQTKSSPPRKCLIINRISSS